MADEIITQEIENNNDIQKYIDTINEMKRNSVSREEYDKVRNENKQLLTTLVNGQAYENASAEASTKTDVKTLRKELYGGDCNLSNLDYWQKTLELREAIIKGGGKDPFLPYGSKIAPTEEDVIKANNVAKVVGECIDYAQGDSAIFTNELQRRTVDTIPTAKRARR